MSEQRVVVVASGGTIPVAPTVSLSGASITANVSGQTLSLAANTVVLTQFQSGFNQVYIGGSGVFTVSASGAGMGSANSGGQVLASCGPIVNATFRNQSGNGPMMIGGVGTNNVPAAGVGIELFAGEILTLRITNTNQVSVFNETIGTSGQAVGIITTANYY